MAQKTILAVALGESLTSRTNKSRVIRDNSPGTLNGVRPYISGLITWLQSQPNPPVPDDPLPTYSIGDPNDYVIDYRECLEAELGLNTFTVSAGLPATYVILCLSSSVATAAANFTAAMKPPPPVVAIVSDPFAMGFPANVCGVSALRSQHAMHCYHQFKKADKAVGQIYALHKQKYKPSADSLMWLGNKVIPVPISPGDNIQTAINNIPAGTNRGLLVLPADLFFGAADNIATWAQAKSMHDFWSVPDWPANSYGGYGFPQGTCGQYLAERIASIWANNGAIPNPPWVPVDESWIRLKPMLKPKSMLWWQFFTPWLRRSQ
jgi:hypothetical protein